jgi:hypothetical protein
MRRPLAQRPKTIWLGNISLYVPIVYKSGFGPFLGGRWDASHS